MFILKYINIYVHIFGKFPVHIRLQQLCYCFSGFMSWLLFFLFLLGDRHWILSTTACLSVQKPEQNSSMLQRKTSVTGEDFCVLFNKFGHGIINIHYINIKCVSKPLNTFDLLFWLHNCNDWPISIKFFRQWKQQLIYTGLFFQNQLFSHVRLKQNKLPTNN